MSNLAEIAFSSARDCGSMNRETVFEAMGTVTRIEGQIFVVQEDGRELRTRRAVSCLVEPQVHDCVLVASQGHAAYVLAVLERESGPATLTVDGDLSLSLPNGKLRMVARDGVDLVSPKEVNVLAGTLAWHANLLKVTASEVVAIASQVVADLATTKLKGGIFDSVFDRVSGRAKRSYKTVEEIDQLRSKQIDYQASETMSLRSENMVATAKELVKVDGEQIHFG